jgi:hypothetical protein
VIEQLEKQQIDRCELMNAGLYIVIRLTPSLSRMGFDRVYPVYYEISFELETENERDSALINIHRK